MSTCFSAGSLEEYLEIISLLNESITHKGGGQQSGQIHRMWYRGHQKQDYLLLPTLLRQSKGMQPAYGKDRLREDLRHQHFRSKCTHLVSTSPSSKIEWQEILQHHLGSTRLMDWSESAISALMFALEAFIDPTDSRELDYWRAKMTPTVWVLDPERLNNHIYETLKASPDLIEAAAMDICPSAATAKSFCQRVTTLLKNHKDTYFENKEESTLNGIVCLSVIENERHINESRLYNLLKSGEFNPFFYLLLRYYSDGLSIPMDTLPPLAIVHPYHSRRIENQHGVFTVAPHYQIDKKDLGGVADKRPMERQPLIQDCLYKINILRPAKVAKELLTIGERRVGLYPELDVYVRDIETSNWKV